MKINNNQFKMFSSSQPNRNGNFIPFKILFLLLLIPFNPFVQSKPINGVDPAFWAEWQQASLAEHELVTNREEYLENKLAPRFEHWKLLAMERELTEKEKEEFEAELTKMVSSRRLRFESPRDGTVFWSGWNTVAAQEWARGEEKTTLEQTEGGYLLSTLDLFDNFNLWGQLGREPPIEKKKSGAIWNIAAEKYAMQARGDVFIFDENTPFIGPSGSVRTLYRVEIPLLLRNGAVGKFQRMAANGEPIGEAMTKLEACKHFMRFLPKPNCGQLVSRKRNRTEEMKISAEIPVET